MCFFLLRTTIYYCCPAGNKKQTKQDLEVLLPHAYIWKARVQKGMTEAPDYPYQLLLDWWQKRIAMLEQRYHDVTDNYSQWYETPAADSSSVAVNVSPPASDNNKTTGTETETTTKTGNETTSSGASQQQVLIASAAAAFPRLPPKEEFEANLKEVLNETYAIIDRAMKRKSRWTRRSGYNY